jgi:hypothetical protein
MAYAAALYNCYTQLVGDLMDMFGAIGLLLPRPAGPFFRDMTAFQKSRARSAAGSLLGNYSNM